MFTAIEALRYRCLRDISVPLGPFQVLVGPNGSGKSTFLDVLNFLHDALNDGLESAIFSERVHLFEDLVWKNEADMIELAVEAEIPKDLPAMNPSYPVCRYEIQIGVGENPGEPLILSEELRLLENTTVEEAQQVDSFPTSRPIRATIMGKDRQNHRYVVRKVPGGKDSFQTEYQHKGKDVVSSFNLGPKKLALANLPDDVVVFPAATWLRRLLRKGIQKLVLNSEAMRKPSPPYRSMTLSRTDGSDLAWIIYNLASANKQMFKNWIEHLRVVLPDLVAIKTIEQPEDKHRYIKVKYANGLEIPAWGLSEGTVRMLALTLLAYLPGTGNTYLIEEPENGIHPGALETVFQSLSSVYDSQVFLATHSPAILNMTDLEQILCFGMNKEGATDVIPGSEHPRLRDWKKKTPLGDLFAAGVLG